MVELLIFFFLKISITLTVHHLHCSIPIPGAILTLHCPPGSYMGEQWPRLGRLAPGGGFRALHCTCACTCTCTCTCIDTNTITSTSTLLFSCSPHRGVGVSLVDGTQPEEVAAAVDHTTKLVWLEVICDKSSHFSCLTPRPRGVHQPRAAPARPLGGGGGCEEQGWAGLCHSRGQHLPHSMGKYRGSG